MPTQQTRTHTDKTRHLHARRGNSGSTAAELAQRNPDRPLTMKQREFIKYWAEGHPITHAATLAGFSDRSTAAYKMAKDPAVLKIYNQEKAKYEAAAGMTRKKVMDGLIEAVEMAKLQADPTAMIAGWREVGKMCGYYAPIEKRVKVDVNGEVLISKMMQLSDAELLKIAQGNVIDGVATQVQDQIAGQIAEVVTEIVENDGDDDE